MLDPGCADRRVRDAVFARVPRDQLVQAVAQVAALVGPPDDHYYEDLRSRYSQSGELRQRYREGQEDQLGALGLVVNAVVLWNTRYLDAAVAQFRTSGGMVRPEDVARLSPLLLDHINVLGRYEFALKESNGFQLLEMASGPTAPAWLNQVPAVEILHRVWQAQFYLDEGRVRWRKAADLPPAGQRIDSPYDPEATFGNKRSTTWIGYKVHLIETSEAQEVHLITNVETTLAVIADVDQTGIIPTALATKGLLPGDPLLDAGYVDAELLVGSQSEHGVRLVGPVRPDVSWQAKAGQGFDVSHFTIDWEAQRVTCPEGKTSVLWKPGRDRWGNEVIHTEFARRECLACRSRSVCTRATTEGREMTVRPRERHEALQAARQQQETWAWKAEYAVRAGIEGTISEGVRGFGLRRCRYIGLAKAHLQHVTTASAMNLSRLADVPRAKTRTSRFARLALAG